MLELRAFIGGDMICSSGERGAVSSYLQTLQLRQMGQEGGETGNAGFEAHVNLELLQALQAAQQLVNATQC